MYLLTDGTKNNPILGFCLETMAKHRDQWPPAEEVLAEDFVNWLGFHTFLTREALQQLCQYKRVNLSFAALPQEIRGVNFSFQDKKEIVITDDVLGLFSDPQTLFHEFREMLEHGFVELGHATLAPQDSLEVRAEIFAIACRIKAMEREVPAYFEMAQKIEKQWVRCLAFVGIGVFAFAYFLSCIYAHQMEELTAEVNR